MDDNTQSWMDFGLRPYDQGGLGLQRHQVAGLLGNLVRESGAGLPSWGPTGDNGTAWGTAQWRNDRLDALKRMFPDSYQTPQAQQAFMRHEFGTTHNNAYKALQAAQDPESAATAVNRLYEVSADNTGGREASARAIMAGNDPLGAINRAAGIQQQGAMPGGALSFSGEPAAAAPPQDDSTGGVLFKGEGPNKLQSLGAMMSNIASSLAGIGNPAQARALHEQAQGIEAQAGSQYQYQMGPNGQLIRINKRDGTVDSRAIPDAQKESFKPIMGKDDMGNPTFQGTFNATTGEYKSAGGGNAAPGPMVGGDPNLTGQERYGTLSPAEQRQVDAWHEGTGIQPSQYSMRNNPKMQKLMDAAQAVYPDMDFQKYGERQQFVRGYANKSPAQFGGQLVSIEHTADLVGQQADRYLKLGNSAGGIGGYGATATNYAKNLTGGNERASNLNALKASSETLSGEYQTMITRGKGGGQAERADYASNVNKPLDAPEVQAAGLQSMLDGLKARHQEIVNAALSAGGQSWVDRHPDVDKKIQATIDKVQAKIDQLTGGKDKAKDAAPAAPAPQYQEGMTATGPNGQKIKFTNGQWAPLQ